MPNLLLINTDKSLIERLLLDKRWSIGIAKHTRDNTPPSLNAPDPRHWDLVIDDCKGPESLKPDVIVTDEEFLREHGITAFTLNNQYLGQCERAHGLRMAPRDESHFYVYGPSRNDELKELEFNLSNERGKPLTDFLHRFRRHFAQRMSVRPYGEDAVELFQNAYDSTVTALDDYVGFETLYLLDIPEVSMRVEALEYLCVRTAPKLWPEMYYGSFQPARVVKWLEEQSEIVRASSEKLAELDRLISEEEAFYSRYLTLLYIGDDDLKDKVGRVFEEIFGAKVTDLDEEEDGAKTSDLLLETESGEFLLEVAGSTNRNAKMEELDDFDEHYDQLRERCPNAHRVLIFNGQYRRGEEERLSTPTFSEGVTGEGVKRRVALLDTHQLLRAIESVRNGELRARVFMECLQNPGRVEGFG